MLPISLPRKFLKEMVAKDRCGNAGLPSRDRKSEGLKAHLDNIVSSKQDWAAGGLSQQEGGREDEKERRRWRKSRRERGRERDTERETGGG